MSGHTIRDQVQPSLQLWDDSAYWSALLLLCVVQGWKFGLDPVRSTLSIYCIVCSSHSFFCVWMSVIGCVWMSVIGGVAELGIDGGNEGWKML